jgi:hypothetical protein
MEDAGARTQSLSIQSDGLVNFRNPIKSCFWELCLMKGYWVRKPLSESPCFCIPYDSAVFRASTRALQCRRALGRAPNSPRKTENRAEEAIAWIKPISASWFPLPLDLT